MDYLLIVTLFFVFVSVLIVLGATGNFRKVVNWICGFVKQVFSWLWSYRETRFMVAACVVVYFASTVFNSKIEVKTVHQVDVKMHHDFSGNLYSPISIQLSDPGYPLKFEVKNK